MSPTTDYLFTAIRTWGEERDLLSPDRLHAQMLKMTEEVGELAHAIARNQLPQAQDALGDCIVVLTLLASQLNLRIEDCMASAYEEIRHRKGKTVNGLFIKNEDHPEESIFYPHDEHV